MKPILIALCLTLPFIFSLSPLHADEHTAPSNREAVPLIFNDPQSPEDSSKPKGRISIRIDNIRNTEGHLNIALFRNKKGFPDEPDKAYVLAQIATNEPPCEVVIENIPYGSYAVSILHDENGNSKMDKTWLGKPKEGFGTSNNPKIRLGPPQFDESGFVLDREAVTMVITMKYM